VRIFFPMIIIFFVIISSSCVSESVSLSPKEKARYFYTIDEDFDYPITYNSKYIK